MPTYGYECPKCQTQEEIFHAMSDKTERVCGKCKGILTKLIGNGSGVIFRGSGWYCKDYPKNTNKKEMKCGD